MTALQILMQQLAAGLTSSTHDSWGETFHVTVKMGSDGSAMYAAANAGSDRSLTVL